MSKLRIALLGTGGIVAKHVKVLDHSTEAEIVAACDVSIENVEHFFSKAYEGKTPPAIKPKCFDNAEEMYSEVKPDAVIICTPHTLHFEHGMQALEHECHVLLEKPMVTDARQAYELAEKVKQTGKVLLVGFNTSCSPKFHYLREIIRTGELGKLQLVNGYITQNWLELTEGLWRRDPKLAGGGMAYDSGAHLLNSLCWSVESRVAKVFSFVDNCGLEVDINSSLNICFENGVFASIAVGGDCSSNGADMHFIFSGGRVDIDAWNATWIRVYKGNSEIEKLPIQGDDVTPVENLIDVILGRGEPCTTPENGIIHSELMDAIYESARLGQAVKPKEHALA